jgi:hypothetical protein
MSKRKPPLNEAALAFFQRTGRKGGKRSLETMTKAERTARARKAAQARPRKLDWDGILKMRSEGATTVQVAEAFGCTQSAVSKIVSRMRGAKKRASKDV